MEGAGFKASIRRRFAQHRNTRATILTSSSLLAIFIASLISKGCVSDVRFTRSRPGLKGSRIRILVTSPRFAFLRETNVSFLLFSASEPHSFSSPFCLLSSFFFFPLFFFFPFFFFFFFLLPPSLAFFFPLLFARVEERPRKGWNIRWWILGSLTFLLRPERSFLRSWCGKSSPYATRRSGPFHEERNERMSMELFTIM